MGIEQEFNQKKVTMCYPKEYLNHYHTEYQSVTIYVFESLRNHL